MERDISQGIDIKTLLEEIESHYVLKAWQQSGKRKKQAANLLGYKNHQTLNNRIEKLGVILD